MKHVETPRLRLIIHHSAISSFSEALHFRVAAKRALLILRMIVLLTLSSLTACTKFDVLNSMIPPCGSLKTTDVPYGSLPRQKLDVYKPKNAPANPGIVIFFHGGSWQSGSKADYRFVAQALTSRGFIAVLPNYRLYPQVTFPAFVQDAALATRWVHDNAHQIGGDAGHVYLMGHSAGAHIVALLTLDGHYLHDAGIDRGAIRATAALAGPFDFVPSPGDRAVFGMAPADVAPNADIEPIHFVDGHAPPMLLITGLEDDTVDASNTARLAARIRDNGGIVKVITYPGRGHVQVVLALAWPFRWLAPVLRDSTMFFHEHR